jgi:DNA-directed RNA polymerase II subunit RPB2
MEHISWKIIDKYFTDNPNNLVAHHLDSYNSFFNQGIHRVFRENNPVRFIENEDDDSKQRNECLLYLGGKEGNKIYFGKPIIYDDNHTHFMFPNDARLRNMTYGVTIHYEVDVDYIYYDGDEKKIHTSTLPEKIFLGRFPIMLQSDLCILKNLDREVRFNMGECRNDYGGYFIIDGKEKLIVSQETFADNMLYIKKHADIDIFTHSAEIRSVSEDTSKPIRTTAVRIVGATAAFSNQNIVVDIPNVRKPVPLFILMRALGVISDKDIITTCLLDLEHNASYIDLFRPSIHDAKMVFTREIALKYIATFTKTKTISGVNEILSDYFLPHIGELNFQDKAYFIGYMVQRLLRVFTNEDKPTDRDNFRFKRVELTGSLLYDLFREYFLIQNKEIAKRIDKEYYYHKGEYKGDTKDNKYKDNFVNLIETNYKDFFKERDVETGFKKAFKGNWGSQSNTKRLGVVQDLNRLSWNTFISHLRKTNLPLEASAKIVGPRHLHGSQWGYIDPLDTPDGGNIGLHKHLSISTHITSGSSAYPIIKWLRAYQPMKLKSECSMEFLAFSTKIFVNGNWIGVVNTPIELVNEFKLYRRNGILPTFASISFNYKLNEIYIYTDSGRLTRPIYYIDNGVPSYKRENAVKLIDEEKISWEQIVSGIHDKKDPNFSYKYNKLYEFDELYSTKISLEAHKSIVDYLDASEEESTLIAINDGELGKSRFYTHVEIDPSLLLGVMGNQIIFPENNPFARNSFSCGQSKQAVSVYHSNHQMRIDTFGVVLNYGQTPLVKSRYVDYINHEEQPYGVNAIIAIMSYTGYNVEDAILINEGSIKRGLFNTTYYTMYEAHEQSARVSGTSNSKFVNVLNHDVKKMKPGYNYSLLDEHGMIQENTKLDDKVVLIGKVTYDEENKDVIYDDSKKTKKGQLGYVDKAFMTQGEEGFNIAKVRVREERIPAMGDKFACALPTQQVLTDHGWMEIQNVDIGKHKLATLDVNGHMAYEHPVNKFEYQHDGDMYSLRNQQLQLTCTLNHKLYVKRGIDLKYKLVEAVNTIGARVRFQKSMRNVYPYRRYFVTNKGLVFNMDMWLKLLGIFFINKPVSEDKIRHILNALKIEHHDVSLNDTICMVDPNIAIELNKPRLPDYVWKLSKKQCMILVDSMITDSVYNPDIIKTINKGILDDISRLIIHCGWTSTCEENKVFDVIHYQITINRKNNQPFKDYDDEMIIQYKGLVYCVEMSSSHLYYMRENDKAPSMLVGNSRAGQKGTIGLIIAEEDMPFTAEGIKPDMIINPHALPSRMTIGQILESIIGISGLHYGAFGDCTAFQTNGSNVETFSKLLVNAGFNSSGDQILYNGMTGEQLETNIFIGPTYYMRLKHMVKDKINFRARGPNTNLTRQPVQGRSNDGGLRIGEMERDGVMGHGMSYFLNESFLTRGDEYMMAVCNKTGLIAIYNEEKNLFMSPFADGPLNFNINSDGTMNIKTLTRFGRSFSLLKIPYSFKLLIQELMVMNVQMRLITDDNIDQMLNMSYSTNINKLLNDNDENLSKVINKYVTSVNENKNKKGDNKDAESVENEAVGWDDKENTPTSEASPTSPEIPGESPEYPAVLPPSEQTPESPLYQPATPDYPPPQSPLYQPTSPDYPPPQSPLYQPTSPDYPPPQTPEYQPTTPDYPPPQTPEYQPTTPDYPPPLSDQSPADANRQLNALGNSMPSSVLDVVEDKPAEAASNSGENASDTGSKKIIIDIKQPDSSNSDSKQITF